MMAIDVMAIDTPGMRRPVRAVLLTGALVATLAGCTGTGGNLDWDLRRPGAGLSTAEAARLATADRPRADSRGVISYPGYQVVVAQRGDTVAAIASRLGLSASDLGRQNAIQPDLMLRAGEVLVLPGRVPEASVASGPVPAQTGTAVTTGVDVGAIATTALDRVAPTAAAPAATPAASPAAAPTAAPPAAPPATPTAAAAAPRAAPPAGVEPKRHRVLRGETAYSVARLYNVTARALADWNGLGPDMALREGQTLLIPPALPHQPARSAAAEPPPPGTGSATPEPPSAARPLPAETPPAASARVEGPASPNLGTQRSATAARFAMPADGKVIRAYQKGRYDGIGIGAAAGSPVRAAADGTVAAITRDTDQVPIVVMRHEGNLLTVYANVDGITVSKDATVKRGQTIGKVRPGNPAFLHFEVRRGSDSVDPMGYLQ